MRDIWFATCRYIFGKYYRKSLCAYKFDLATPNVFLCQRSSLFFLCVHLLRYLLRTRQIDFLYFSVNSLNALIKSNQSETETPYENYFPNIGNKGYMNANR